MNIVDGIGTFCRRVRKVSLLAFYGFNIKRDEKSIIFIILVIFIKIKISSIIIDQPLHISLAIFFKKQKTNTCIPFF